MQDLLNSPGDFADWIRDRLPDDGRSDEERFQLARLMHLFSALPEEDLKLISEKFIKEYHPKYRADNDKAEEK